MVIDPQLYRYTLGHYPTGVVLVTAQTEDGPVGLVIGSFTSLSLDPPLVAFMPMKSSGTYAQIQQVGRFCVNVLAADQLGDCRLFASRAEDKFGKVAWHPAPSGAPILDDAVSWLDCRLTDSLEGGDHWIALGEIEALDVQRRELPLLFFQGGYGRFHTASLVAASTPALLETVRLADNVRPRLEDLAASLRAEVALVVETGEWMTFVAVANASDLSFGVATGHRLPLIAPVGSVFLDGDPETTEAWLARLPRVEDEVRARLRDMGSRVRELGYSLSTLSGNENEIWEMAGELTGETVTPAREKELKALLLGNMYSYEPELDDGQTYNVRAITVPVERGNARPKLALRVANPPGGASVAMIYSWIDEIKKAARDISAAWVR